MMPFVRVIKKKAYHGFVCIRISFHGVTKITKKMNKLEQTQKEIVASLQELKSKPSDQNGMSQKEVETLVREEFEEQKRIEDRIKYKGLIPWEQ